MKTPRCPLCRVVMQHSEGRLECPACGRTEEITVQDVLTTRTPEPFDARKAFAAMRAAVDSPSQPVPASGRTLHTLHHVSNLPASKTPNQNR